MLSVAGCDSDNCLSLSAAHQLSVGWEWLQRASESTRTQAPSSQGQASPSYARGAGAEGQASLLLHFPSVRESPEMPPGWAFLPTPAPGAAVLGGQGRESLLLLEHRCPGFLLPLWPPGASIRGDGGPERSHRRQKEQRERRPGSAGSPQGQGRWWALLAWADGGAGLTGGERGFCGGPGLDGGALPSPAEHRTREIGAITRRWPSTTSD